MSLRVEACSGLREGIHGKQGTTDTLPPACHLEQQAGPLLPWDLMASVSMPSVI